MDIVSLKLSPTTKTKPNQIKPPNATVYLVLQPIKCIWASFLHVASHLAMTRLPLSLAHLALSESITELRFQLLPQLKINFRLVAICGSYKDDAPRHCQITGKPKLLPEEFLQTAPHPSTHILPD